MEISDRTAEPSLYDLLLKADLLNYIDDFTNKLRITSADHLKYVSESDLDDIGMTRPEQRRLVDIRNKLYPASVFGKLKKVVKDRISSSPHTKSSEKYDKLSLSSSSDFSFNNEQQHIISSSKIILCQQLGSGEFGQVWQGVWRPAQNQKILVAIKKISSDKLTTNILSFIQEAAIMHKIHSDNIVRFFGVVLEPKNIMLVSELAPLRSLLECLKQPLAKVNFNILRLCEFAHQICTGMVYLEENRLIHRDLAARNILVFSVDQVKISDFGLSRSLGSGEDYYRGTDSAAVKLPIAWCAPESIRFMKFTTSSDIWSFGVTLWEMFSYGLQPWLGLTGRQILETIDAPSCQRLEMPDDCPSDLYTLMLQMWHHEPEKRPKFSELHTFLMEIHPETLRSVTECSDGQPDHLQYDEGDLVVVLNKIPREYPDGYFWKGAVIRKKIGTPTCRTGLFLPINFVTHLSMDCTSLGNSTSLSDFQTTTASMPGTPSSDRKFLSANSLIRDTPTKHQKKESKKSRDGFSNKHSSKSQKLSRKQIGLPENDFRHTGHVGIDGMSFGDVEFLQEEPMETVLLENADIHVTQPNLNGGMPKFPTSWAKAQMNLAKAAPPRPPKKKIFSSTSESTRLLPNDSSSSPGSEEGIVPSSQSMMFTCKTSPNGSGSLLDEVFDELNSLDFFTKKSNYPTQQKTEDCVEKIRNYFKLPVEKSFSKPVAENRTLAPGGIKPMSPADEKFLDDLTRMAEKMSDRTLEAERRHHINQMMMPHKFPNVLVEEESERMGQSKQEDEASMMSKNEDDSGAKAYKILVERAEDVNPLRLIRNNGTHVALSFQPRPSNLFVSSIPKPDPTVKTKVPPPLPPKPAYTTTSSAKPDLIPVVDLRSPPIPPPKPHANIDLKFGCKEEGKNEDQEKIPCTVASSNNTDCPHFTMESVDKYQLLDFVLSPIKSQTLTTS